MKTDIHPEYNLVTVTCSCGNTFETRSTATELKVELCSQCHPFYTGKQKLVDTGGRIDRFERRFGKRKRPGQSAESETEVEAQVDAPVEAEVDAPVEAEVAEAAADSDVAPEAEASTDS